MSLDAEGEMRKPNWNNHKRMALVVFCRGVWAPCWLFVITWMLKPSANRIGLIRLCIWGGGKVSVVRCVHLGIRRNILKIPSPPPVLSALFLNKCPNNQFLANTSRSTDSRGNIVGIENVPREISYGTSLVLSISLKIHSNKYKRRFWPFFTFLAIFLQICRNLWGLGEKS